MKNITKWKTQHIGQKVNEGDFSESRAKGQGDGKLNRKKKKARKWDSFKRFNNWVTGTPESENWENKMKKTINDIIHKNFRKLKNMSLKT